MTITPVAARRLLKLIRVAPVVVSIVVVVAAVDITMARLTVTDTDRLGELPEASLFYPRSVVLEGNGGHNATAFAHAQIFRILGSQGSMEEILEFYNSELASRGWETGGGSSGIRSTGETKVCAWHTDQHVLRLGFLKMDDIRERVPAWAMHATVYDLRLIDHGVGTTTLRCTFQE